MPSDSFCAQNASKGKGVLHYIGDEFEWEPMQEPPIGFALIVRPNEQGIIADEQTLAAQQDIRIRRN